MASRARYSKIVIANPGESKRFRSAAGSVVIADYLEGGMRTLVLERQQSAGKPRVVRKAKAAATGTATAFPEIT